MTGRASWNGAPLVSIATCLNESLIAKFMIKIYEHQSRSLGSEAPISCLCRNTVVVFKVQARAEKATGKGSRVKGETTGTFLGPVQWTAEVRRRFNSSPPCESLEHWGRELGRVFCTSSTCVHTLLQLLLCHAGSLSGQ